MATATPAFASLTMFRNHAGFLQEIYPLGARLLRPDAETLCDVRLLFGDRFKELHAELPPEPPLLMAGAVFHHDDDSDMGEFDEDDEDDEDDDGAYDDFDDFDDFDEDEDFDEDGEMFW